MKNKLTQEQWDLICERGNIVAPAYKYYGMLELDEGDYIIPTYKINDLNGIVLSAWRPSKDKIGEFTSLEITLEDLTTDTIYLDVTDWKDTLSVLNWRTEDEFINESN